MFILALASTQPSGKWVLGLFLGVKWLGCEANCSPPSSAEVSNEYSYTLISTICFHGMNRDNFTFYVISYEQVMLLSISKRYIMAVFYNYYVWGGR
jgi:hypothetical protein